jgi:hypothetical protein
LDGGAETPPYRSRSIFQFGTVPGQEHAFFLTGRNTYPISNNGGRQIKMMTAMSLTSEGSKESRLLTRAALLRCVGGGAAPPKSKIIAGSFSFSGVKEENEAP